MNRALLPLLCFALSPVVWCQPRELLQSGGFEGGADPAGHPQGWTVLEGDVRLTHSPVHGGAAALKAVDPGPGASVSVDSAHSPCSPGDVHLATAWLRSEAPARPSFYLQFFDATGRRIGVLARFPSPGEDWTRVVLAAVTPREAASVSALIFSGSGETGRFQADDVSLQRWSAEEIGLGGMVPNPSFELTGAQDGAPPGWLGAAGQVTVTAEATHSGARSLRLTSGPDRSAEVRSTWCAARPGQRWRASGWARAEAGAKARLTLDFVDGFLNVLGSADGSTDAGDWTQVSADAIAPGGTTGAMVRLHADAGSAWFDDVTSGRIPREGPEVLDIGQNRQLFLDDYLVDEMSLLERVWNRPIKEPRPAIVPDRPWEQSSFLGILGNSVFYDEPSGQYRLYYVIYQMIERGEFQHYAVAVSQDGLHWEKPNLGVASYEGSTDNNLLFDHEARLARYQEELVFYSNFIRDPHDPDPARRYKALGFQMQLDGSGRGMMVAFSPDGLHFSEAPENPVLPNGDTNVLLGWDERIGKYVAYPRTDGPTSARDVGYSTSEDFIHWTEAQTVIEPIPGDPPHYEIYEMPVVKYQGLYLGFPWAFIADGLEPLDTQFAFSRDGTKWQRDPTAPMFIPRGRPGQFDDSYAVTANPIEVGDELLFYYMACGFPHGYAFTRETKFEGAIGLARLRLDGFASLSCHAQSGGHVVTRPLRFTGSKMIVNCDCPLGWLRVELQDEAGAPIPGYAEADCDAIAENAVRQTVTWQGNADVSALAGKTIRVRVIVGDGEFYSFGFEG